MSDEIAQDDDGNFEISDIGFPGDSDDDEEAQVTKGQSHSQSTARVETAGPAAGYQQQVQSQAVARDSLEGDTIFAVGEDGDKASEDGSDEENARLVQGR